MSSPPTQPSPFALTASPLPGGSPPALAPFTLTPTPLRAPSLLGQAPPTRGLSAPGLPPGVETKRLLEVWEREMVPRLEQFAREIEEGLSNPFSPTSRTPAQTSQSLSALLALLDTLIAQASSTPLGAIPLSATPDPPAVDLAARIVEAQRAVQAAFEARRAQRDGAGVVLGVLGAVGPGPGATGR